MSLECKSVSVTLNKAMVLHDLSLTALPGVSWILGPNGAGKSTTLRVLSTALWPDAGCVRILGKDVSGKNVHGLRERIGYLPQSFSYPKRFTVEEFVSYCGWLRCGTVRRQEVAEAMALVELTGERDKRMGSLSGGMLRRAGIASALMGRPPIVILDEPTVGLDPSQRLQFRDALREISATVVISTHLVEDVAALGGTVTVLDGGRSRFSGTVAELIDSAHPDSPGDSPLERGYLSLLDRERVDAA